MHPPAAAANSFLSIARASGESLDPMKIQKLVYFSHGWHLAYDRGALSAENAEAWDYGPVFPDLYQGLKRWGARPVLEPVEVVTFHSGAMRGQRPLVVDDDFANRLMRRVWEVYGGMTGVQLSQLTHERGGPWWETRRAHPNARGPVIPNRTIQEHFRKKLDENAARRREA